MDVDESLLLIGTTDALRSVCEIFPNHLAMQNLRSFDCNIILIKMIYGGILIDSMKRLKIQIQLPNPFFLNVL